MSNIVFSTQNITFQASQSIKTIQLKNISSINNQPHAVMYKIKTNKIECVDAKPSCGYISSREGQNEISIVVRSLSTKEYSAKLQVLYIAHELITEEIVEKNRKHFDIGEYNEFYEKIRAQSQNQVKTHIIAVNKLVGSDSQSKRLNKQSINTVNSKKEQQKPQPKVVSPKPSVPLPQQKPSIPATVIKQVPTSQVPRHAKPSQLTASTAPVDFSLRHIVVALIIGLVIGYLLGSRRNGKNDSQQSGIESTTVDLLGQRSEIQQGKAQVNTATQQTEDTTEKIQQQQETQTQADITEVDPQPTFEPNSKHSSKQSDQVPNPDQVQPLTPDSQQLIQTL